MSAAYDIPDSDQSSARQQRLTRAALFVALIPALLSGCMIGAVKPDQAPATPPPSSQTPVALSASPDATPLQVIPSRPKVIWARLRNSFALSHIEHQRISREIKRLQRSPDSFTAMMSRSEPYLHHIIDAVEAAGLPMELALLPAVESGYRAHVYSPQGAAGLWQFMPATGRMFGLKQDWWYDKRRALEPSTGAALVYLSKLNERFNGDWLHALAAYNAGAGKVGKSIRRARRRGEPTDFWSLDLPGETDSYVPRLLALAAVVAEPERYSLSLPVIIDKPYYATVETGGQIDLNVVAEIAGMEVDEVLALNPGHKRWASRPDGPHRLLLPVEKAESFSHSLTTLPADQRLRWQRHRIQPGESLNKIARRYGVSAQAIRQSNGMRNSRIRAGKDLLIPLSDVARRSATGSDRLARQQVRYRVRKGDSLYTIAKRFQVSIADLRRWNQVGRYIRPGERLTVFVDPDA